MSERTLAAKLVKPGDAVWVSDPIRVALLGPLPDGASVVAGGPAADAEVRVAVAFVEDAAAVTAAFDANAEAFKAVPVVWILYPKANRSDVNRDTLWRLIAPYGLRPITNVAVDDTWSALRFRPLRPDEPPFAGGA